MGSARQLHHRIPGGGGQSWHAMEPDVGHGGGEMMMFMVRTSSGRRAQGKLEFGLCARYPVELFGLVESGKPGRR